MFNAFCGHVGFGAVQNDVLLVVNSVDLNTPQNTSLCLLKSVSVLTELEETKAKIPVLRDAPHHRRGGAPLGQPPKPSESATRKQNQNRQEAPSEVPPTEEEEEVHWPTRSPTDHHPTDHRTDYHHRTDPLIIHPGPSSKPSNAIKKNNPK